MKRSLSLLVLTSAMVLVTSVFALPPATADRGGDPAPKPLLTKPPLAAPPAPLPDTTALMPGGKYILRITLREGGMTHPVTLGRNGGMVNAALGGSDTLSGTLDPAGKLQLAGGNGTDRLELSAIVQNRRASGQAQLGRGVNKLVGSFTLDPDTGVSRKMKEYGAPAPLSNCGFWCEMGKAWNCIKNWSNC